VQIEETFLQVVTDSSPGLMAAGFIVTMDDGNIRFTGAQASGRIAP